MDAHWTLLTAVSLSLIFTRTSRILPLIRIVIRVAHLTPLSADFCTESRKDPVPAAACAPTRRSFDLIKLSCKDLTSPWEDTERFLAALRPEELTSEAKKSMYRAQGG